MMPIIEHFNDYRFFLAEGGRASAKTNTIARLVLYLCEHRTLRVVCGRETQNTIDESVYKILADLIKEYKLDYNVTKNTITHRKSKSEILFKGFREQGRANIKGMEGVDILWIDEAEAITKQTLDIIVPTIRKPKSKIIFTMNRFVRNDPVYEFCLSRENCLMIHIDYFENPFCSEEVKAEAEACKNNNYEEYKHIWLGYPLENASDYLFNASKVAEMKKIIPNDEGFTPRRVIGFDFAAKGGDLCVASIMERVSLNQWKLVRQESWGDTEPTTSIGRIVNIIGEWKPDTSILDVGGMGTVVWSRLRELGVDIERFDGATKQGVPDEYLNARAYGYYTLRRYVDNGLILMNNNDTERELLQIRYDYKSDGTRLIMSKEKMRKEGLHSPDRADSLMMAVYAIENFAKKDSYKPVVIKTTKRWKGR
jgi:phage terminase large subunit